MTTNLKITKAVALALTGTALALGGASSANAAVTTMYNLTTAAAADNSTNTTNPTDGGVWALWGGNTDGWMNGFTGESTGTGVNTGGAKWAGTGGTYNAPFGYVGAHMNWGFEITGGNGGSGTISTFDAFAQYGTYADIDTAKGAWSATNTGTVFGGWRHDLDVGLFRSDATGTVTLSVTGIINPSSNYGFTIFQGMDTAVNWGHHGQWNNNNNSFAPPLSTNSSPYEFGGASVGKLLVSDIIAYSVGNIGSVPASNLNSIQFEAQAGQIYTIFIGGYRNGNWGDTVDGYNLTISQVPVPAAVWLFGSAIAGLGVIGRRRK